MSFFFNFYCNSSTKPFSFLFSVSFFSLKNSNWLFSSRRLCTKFLNSSCLSSDNRSYFFSLSDSSTLSCILLRDYSIFWSLCCSLESRLLHFRSWSSILAWSLAWTSALCFSILITSICRLDFSTSYKTMFASVDFDCLPTYSVWLDLLSFCAFFFSNSKWRVAFREWRSSSKCFNYFSN